MKPLDEKLEGTWVTEDEDSDAVFTFKRKPSGFEVSDKCLSDGEEFVIKDVTWDGTNLQFTATMPSTGFRSKNIFRLRSDGKADLELTTYEVWTKKPNS